MIAAAYQVKHGKVTRLDCYNVASGKVERVAIFEQIMTESGDKLIAENAEKLTT